MSISLFKKNNNFSALRVIHYTFFGIITVAIVFFSWLFLFVYKQVYFAIVEETAIINLRSQLVITKVHKTQFDNLLKKYKEKQNPAIILNFKNIKNPFKTEVK